MNAGVKVVYNLLDNSILTIYACHSYVGCHYSTIYSVLITIQHFGKIGQICLDAWSTISKEFSGTLSDSIF